MTVPFCNTISFFVTQGFLSFEKTISMSIDQANKQRYLCTMTTNHAGKIEFFIVFTVIIAIYGSREV